jgi:diacylglycerol kinase family enzyme
MATVPYQHIRVIVNPAAGQNEPILNTLNEVFHRHELEWDVRITLGPGDATRLAREAVANGVDLVAGYGGDGTQMEIANGVMGSNTPMAILPGGTGNAMTFELKIPRNLKQAAELICQSGHRRKIDLGRIGERHFMREEKDRLGLLAYPAASLRVLKSLTTVHYRLSLAGREIEDEGLMCYIFNAGSTGGAELPTPLDISASDGLLDVLILNKNPQSVRAIASYVLDVGQSKLQVHHWQGLMASPTAKVHLRPRSFLRLFKW